MKQKAMRKPRAMTLFELIVVLAVILVLAAMLLPALKPVKTRSGPGCMNYLKEIGTAYRLWADDNGGLAPPQETVAKGGWADLLTNANQGAICWTNYSIMQNELGQSPRTLISPQDERIPAANLTTNLDNTHISYFIGVSANDRYPQSILAGDRNIGPGTKPDRDYGYSPKNGKGNDIAIPISGPVSWSLKMH